MIGNHGRESHAPTFWRHFCQPSLDDDDDDNDDDDDDTDDDDDDDDNVDDDDDYDSEETWRHTVKTMFQTNS